MNRTYLGAVMGEGESFGIVFLDFPGCVSAGSTVEGTLAMGGEALQGHIRSMIDDGDAIPEPTMHDVKSVDEWLSDPGDPLDEPWVGLFPITVDTSANHDTVMVAMKADLVRRIAESASDLPLQFSTQRFVEQAVEHELDRRRKTA